jgi:hypothetical protein
MRGVCGIEGLGREPSGTVLLYVRYFSPSSSSFLVFGRLVWNGKGNAPPAVGQIEAISAREQAIAIVPRNVMILLHDLFRFLELEGI